jgi:4-hydroxy-tetrahydrodipicolinate reductase
MPVTGTKGTTMYKVFQWATGTVGSHAIRETMRRANLDLVGVHTTGSMKAGLDAAELLGDQSASRSGVTASQTLDTVLTSSADIVLHMPLPSLVYGEHPQADLDDICAMLAAGKNVITVVGYLYPAVHGEEIVSRLTAACSQGNSTFHSTGLNPGWMGDLLPVVMSCLSRDIEQVVVREITNFEFYPSPEIMFDSMGFGSSPEEFSSEGQRRRTWLNGLFAESIQMVADGIGMALDDINDTLEIARAPSDLRTAAGTVPQGTVAGQHWEWSGQVKGEKRIIHETVWRMHQSVAPDWPQGTHMVKVTGTPSIRLDIAPDWITDGLMATAMHAVNAVPHVCAAPAGICTLLDLPRSLVRG